MREILFRGKTYDGGWVEGALLPFRIPTICKATYIPELGDPMIGESAYSYYPVIPESIGQFTELYDKNKKRIFEGDIIQLDSVICEITYENGGFQMITNKQQGLSHALQDRVKHFIIIGNSYDNSNLCP